MKPLAVEVRGLTKTYPGGVQAVRGIDFDVLPGEVFGLLGPNGAGKSTTDRHAHRGPLPRPPATLASPAATSSPSRSRRAGVSAVVFQDVGRRPRR